MLGFVVDAWTVAQAEGFQLPLTEQMLALVPIIAAALMFLRTLGRKEGEESFLDKNTWLLPILAVAMGVGISFLMGDDNAVLSGFGVGIATCYSYDMGKTAIKAVAKLVSGPANPSS